MAPSLPLSGAVLRIFRHYVPGLVLLVFAGDQAIIALSVLAADASGMWVGAGATGPKLLLVAALVTLALYLGDLYNMRLGLGRREMIARLLICQGAAGIAIAAVGFALPSLRLGRFAFFTIVMAATLGLAAWRAAWLSAHESMELRVLVVGAGPVARSIAELVPTSSRPFTIIGFLDDSLEAVDSLPEGYELLAKTNDLTAIVEETHPDLVVVAQIERRGQFPAKALLDCRLQGIQVEDWPTFYEKATGKILVTSLRPSWLIFADGFVKTRRTEVVKRFLDMSLAFIGLVLALPIMAAVAIAIKLESQGAVLFRQPRLGQSGSVFILNKFRSMRQNAEKDTGPVWARNSDPRVTRIGAFLRKTRLDELPQLFNVLVGHMSFIGPRPERPEFVYDLQNVIPFYMERLSVKPGITGWAQVRYPYGASVDDALQKLQYDLYYIKNLSLFLDLLILLNTVQVVLFARGR
jgi:sugar transferase (PEP-CTERM system associated)